LARLVAVQVAKGQYDLAVKSAQVALDVARNDAEPRLKELEAKMLKLKQALAHFYSPTTLQFTYWRTHWDEIWAAGGTPPDETEWRVELALTELERCE
jgi:hypothetical protein